jgi:DNA-directed RNA polymerase I subunit RPA1
MALSYHSVSQQAAALDGPMMSELAPMASGIFKECLPIGQEKPIPQYCFSLMVLTGAKGSMVNHSQVCHNAVFTVILCKV